MNKFNCFNNMQISRYAAIKYAQLMANSNALTLFNAMTNNGWGVLTSITSDGLLPDGDTSLKVTRKTSTKIDVAPGVAITPAGDVAVNSRVTTIDVAAAIAGDTGVYNLYIKHATTYKVSGEETFYAGHTSSTVGTLEYDSCEFELTKSTLPDQVLLATILCDAGATLIPTDIIINSAALIEGAVIYPDEEAIQWSEETANAILGSVIVAQLPTVRIGSELLTRISGNNWTRGDYSTNAGTYYGGVNPLSWSAIVDKRQTNAFRLTVSLGDIDRLKSGIVEVSPGVFRHMALILKKDSPSVPTISSRNTIVWLNSHLAAGYLTADMIAAYEEIQGIQTSIANTLAAINQLSQDYAEATGSSVTQERLLNELQKQRMVLLDYRTRQSNLTTVLATRTMDSLSNNDIRNFAYMVIIDEPQHDDTIDEPVMYEAEVEYYVVDTPASASSATRKRWFNSRRKNIEEIDWPSMEMTYEGITDPDDLFRSIDIPIKFGERIRYRVRAIGESGAVSEFSAYQNYSFTGYTISQQYIMVSNIYNILHPDPYREGIITRELVDLLYSVIDKYNDYNNRVTAIESQVNDLITEV